MTVRGKSSTASNRRRDIQGLRAVAVLVVVAYHSGLPMPGGFVGVDVFFVISGFVITGMLQREWSSHGRIRFGQFYLRRFRRLTPALALMVSVVVLLSILLLSPFGAQQTVAKTAAGAMFLVANVVIAKTSGGYFDAPAESNPLLNTWSLSVEEQFYLAFPAILALGWMLARRTRAWRSTPLLLICAVAGVSFGLAVLSSLGFSPPRGGWLLGFYGPLTRAWEFALGAILLLGTRWLTSGSRRLNLVLALMGAALLGTSLFAISGSTPYPGFWTLLPVTGTMLLLVAGHGSANPVTEILSTGPMVKVGDWSYSIYLWHWPAIVFAGVLWPANRWAVPVAAMLSFAPAVASYAWVEQPLRTLAPRTRSRGALLIAATLAIPAILAVALEVGAQSQWWMTWPTRASAASGTSGGATHRCASKVAPDSPGGFTPEVCLEGADAGEGTVLLLGDSQATALLPAVAEASSDLGMRTISTARQGCPFSTLDTAGRKPLDCPVWQRQALEYAIFSDPDVAIIANWSTGYTQPEGNGRVMKDEQGKAAATQEEATGLYEQGLNDVVVELTSHGIPVIVAQDIPQPERVYNQASIFRRFFPANTPSTFPEGPAARERAPVAATEATVVAGHHGAFLYDPFPVLCANATCPLTDRGISMYVDRSHLSGVGAGVLVTSLRDTINTVRQDP